MPNSITGWHYWGGAEDSQGEHGICSAHWSEIRAAVTGGPAIIRSRCEECGSLIVARRADQMQCQNAECAADADALRVEEAAKREKRRPREVVYYVAFGGRIKIGTTIDLKQRLRAIHHDQLLAVEPGGYDIEGERHRQFASARVAGQREWFEPSDELRVHIRSVRAEHGKPDRWVA